MKVQTILEKVNNKNIDFDLIYLGHNNNSVGDCIIDNIYNIDKTKFVY
jgi:hypothetical protein